MPERPRRRLDADALWEYALRALSGRAHSIGELREKLLRRAARAEDVKPLLARLKESGLLNDRQFAESFSHSRLENQGFGKFRVLRDLRRRRVAPAVAERAVAGAYGDADEVRLVEDFLRRKYRNVPLSAHLAEPKHLAAAYRKLRLAGFSPASVLGVLKRFAREPELLDSLQSEDEAPEDETREHGSKDPLD